MTLEIVRAGPKLIAALLTNLTHSQTLLVVLCSMWQPSYHRFTTAASYNPLLVGLFFELAEQRRRSWLFDETVTSTSDEGRVVTLRHFEENLSAIFYSIMEFHETIPFAISPFEIARDNICIVIVPLQENTWCGNRTYFWLKSVYHKKNFANLDSYLLVERIFARNHSRSRRLSYKAS